MSKVIPNIPKQKIFAKGCELFLQASFRISLSHEQLPAKEILAVSLLQLQNGEDVDIPPGIHQKDKKLSLKVELPGNRGINFILPYEERKVVVNWILAAYNREPPASEELLKKIPQLRFKMIDMV